MKNYNITVNGHNVQSNFAKGKSIINTVQNNGITSSELDNIIKNIMDNLSDQNNENADKITDVMNMIKEELAKSEPKPSKLKNYFTMIAPMLTIANEMPALTDNLQKLKDYILPHIH